METKEEEAKKERDIKLSKLQLDIKQRELVEVCKRDRLNYGEIIARGRICVLYEDLYAEPTPFHETQPANAVDLAKAIWRLDFKIAALESPEVTKHDSGWWYLPSESERLQEFRVRWRSRDAIFEEVFEKLFPPDPA
jgi:hypothetical protein